MDGELGLGGWIPMIDCQRYDVEHHPSIYLCGIRRVLDIEAYTW